MQGLLEGNWLQLALKILLSGLILLAVGALCGFLISRLRRRFRVELKKEHTITLTNQGNVCSIYHLHAESLEPVLKFEVLQNNIPLPEVFVNIETPDNTSKLPAVHTGDTASVEITSASNKTLPSKDGLNPASAVKNSSKAAEKVVAKSGAVANLLGLLGSILPGSLGKSIKEQGAAVRGMETKTKDVMDKPQAMQRKLDQAQKDTGKLGVKTPAPQIQLGKPSTPGDMNQTPPVLPIQSQVPVSSPTLVGSIKYFCTSEVNPAETLHLTLRIKSKNRKLPEGSYSYSLKSQQVPLKKFDRPIPPSTKQGIVNFGHISKWQYWSADLFSAILTLAGLSASVLFISMIWK